MTYPSVQPTGTDSSVPYTTAALVGRWLPDSYLAPGSGPSTTKGKVTADDIADLINSRSRQIDGRLWKAGLRTPFPSVTAANPALPFAVRDAVTMLVASDVAAIIKYGTRGSEKSKSLGEMAEDAVVAIEENPHSLGHVRVTTPEVFTAQMASGAVETGRMIANHYRMKNRGIITRSVRFVTSAGVEALRPEGLPFLHAVDWKTISPEQGTFWIYNTQILTAIGDGGGIVYDWGWVRLDRHTLGVATLAGVGR